MFVLKKPIWSKYPYGPAPTRPYEYTHIRSDHTRTVRPYEYTHMVWTVRVRTKYVYGLEDKYYFFHFLLWSY